VIIPSFVRSRWFFLRQRDVSLEGQVSAASLCPIRLRLPKNAQPFAQAAFISLKGLWALLVLSCAWYPAHAWATAPCAAGPGIEELLHQGNDPQLPPLKRERAYERAIQLCPGRSDLYHSLSVLLQRQGDFEKSEQWSQRGLLQVPKDFHLSLDRAIALLSSGRVADSVSVLRTLPRSATVEFFLGMACSALQNHKAAQQAFSKAIDLGYEDPYVFYVLLQQDRALHDKDAGLRDFQVFDQRFPDSPWLDMVLGDAHMNRHEYASAESEYEKALGKNPEIVGAHFQLGYLAFTRADYVRATDEFRMETDLAPGFGEPFLYLGLSLRKMGKNDEALPILRKAVALDPNSPAPYGALAAVEISTHHTQMALDSLQTAKKRFPSESAFAAQLAALLKQMGRTKEAAQEAALAQTLGRKNNPSHLLSSAGPLAHDESPPTSASASAPANDPARQLERPTVEAAPNEAPSGGPVEAAREPTSKYEDLVADLRICLARSNAACATAALAAIHDPPIERASEFAELKAQTLALTQQETSDLAPTQRAIKANPAQPDYLITEGRIYLKFGDHLAAIESFLKAAQLAPESPEPLYFLGMSFFLLAERSNSPDYYDRAERHFKSALELSPDYDRAQFLLGVVEAMQSHLNEAKAYLQKTVQMKPSNPYYHLQYGILLNRIGDDREALDEMLLAEKLYPSYALTHSELGKLYEKLADYQQARKQLETAVELNPHLATAYYHLRGVYVRLGLPDKSKEAYNQFLSSKGPGEGEVSDPAALAISVSDVDGTQMQRSR
jgi:tetratricopeptide (TPR) repeat protein